jgi:hypothetical protein
VHPFPSLWLTLRDDIVEEFDFRAVIDHIRSKARSTCGSSAVPREETQFILRDGKCSQAAIQADHQLGKYNDGRLVNIFKSREMNSNFTWKATVTIFTARFASQVFSPTRAEIKKKKPTTACGTLRFSSTSTAFAIRFSADGYTHGYLSSTARKRVDSRTGGAPVRSNPLHALDFAGAATFGF